jgi:hypothetical protein
MSIAAIRIRGKAMQGHFTINGRGVASPLLKAGTLFLAFLLAGTSVLLALGLALLGIGIAAPVFAAGVAGLAIAALFGKRELRLGKFFSASYHTRRSLKEVRKHEL